MTWRSMNKVLKILHFSVMAYSGLVSTLLLFKDDAASHDDHLFQYQSYFTSKLHSCLLITRKSVLLLLILLLGLRFFARIIISVLQYYYSPQLFDSHGQLLILSNYILDRLSSTIFINNVNAPDPVIAIDDPHHERPYHTTTLRRSSCQFGRDHPRAQKETTINFNNYLVDSDTINELALLFAPSHEDHDLNPDHDQSSNHPQTSSIKDDIVELKLDQKRLIQQRRHEYQADHDHDHEQQYDEDDEPINTTCSCRPGLLRIVDDDQLPSFDVDLPHTDIGRDQFLTMLVEHDDQDIEEKGNSNIIEEKRWADEIFDQYHHHQPHHDVDVINGSSLIAGTSIYFDNDINLVLGIQSNDMSTSIVTEDDHHDNENIPAAKERKSLDETWKEIQSLYSSTSPQSKNVDVDSDPDREVIISMMPLTPRRMKVVKLKSSSDVIESRDMNDQWKDKKKTLSFNEEVYLRQRGGMVRSDTLEDIECLNKKFDAFIAQNKQQMLIQRKESQQRDFLEKTSRGGG